MLHPIDAASFDAEVLSADVPVLLDVSTRWCGPCRALVPVLRELEEKRAGKLKIVSLDAEDHPELAARLQVKAFPTLIAFENGKEHARRVGLTTLQRLSEMLDGH
jgi:thioredoxin 1